MASTSTNKQPLLIDRVLHTVVDLNNAVVPSIDVLGTNTATLVVDATTNDGAIIEDIYSVARSTSQYFINLYMSSSIDYLRPNEGIFIGSFETAAQQGQTNHWEFMPRILAPVPHVVTTGLDENQLKALYVPKGRSLWAAIQTPDPVNDGPILGVQGGWY
jgi:hypothetical protein